jgi:predicted naringenin-chalcone synthase
VEADPTGRAVVLVVCAETCSVHISPDPRVELIVGNTLFADGAGERPEGEGGGGV